MTTTGGRLFVGPSHLMAACKRLSQQCDRTNMQTKAINSFYVFLQIVFKSNVGCSDNLETAETV